MTEVLSGVLVAPRSDVDNEALIGRLLRWCYNYSTTSGHKPTRYCQTKLKQQKTKSYSSNSQYSRFVTNDEHLGANRSGNATTKNAHRGSASALHAFFAGMDFKWHPRSACHLQPNEAPVWCEL